jgi:general secretion pathway protein G
MKKRSMSTRRREGGFTLLELLIVIAILGLLGALTAIQLSGYLGRAKVDTAKLQIDQLVAALDLYRLDLGRLPSTDEGLAALLRSPADAANWRGPYLRKSEATVDPWGRPFVYRRPGEHAEYDVFSYGSDGRPGGTGEDADVSNH